MRIVCWNVNGLRTLRRHAQWRTHTSLEACLDALGCDIACFQEAKLTRRQLTHDMCVMAAFEAFFDLHPQRGYSGTATYVRRDACMPLAASTGIASGALDTEGRAVVLDCGLFVLLNIYAPNETDSSRTAFRQAYYDALEARIMHLLAAGRHVVVAGDLNTLVDPRDHCEGDRLAEDRAAFDAHPARAWLARLVAPDGPLIDSTRAAHPHRRGMYTCWNTLIDARSGNYGSRIDYILVSRGLWAWVAHADIWPHVHGSDHCPVVLELHDSLGSRQLVDELHGRAGACPAETPAGAASRMHLFSEPKLSDMFLPHTEAPSMPAPKRQRQQRRPLPQQTLMAYVERGPPAPAPPPVPRAPRAPQTRAITQWGAIFRSPPPPQCTLHREPARLLTVHKAGPNHGRKFWLCARPVGPGYQDRVRTAASREFRCDFFMWDSEWRRRHRGHLAST